MHQFEWLKGIKELFGRASRSAQEAQLMDTLMETLWEPSDGKPGQHITLIEAFSDCIILIFDKSLPSLSIYIYNISIISICITHDYSICRISRSDSNARPPFQSHRSSTSKPLPCTPRDATPPQGGTRYRRALDPQAPHPRRTPLVDPQPLWAPKLLKALRKLMSLQNGHGTSRFGLCHMAI